MFGRGNWENWEEKMDKKVGRRVEKGYEKEKEALIGENGVEIEVWERGKGETEGNPTERKMNQREYQL